AGVLAHEGFRLVENLFVAEMRVVVLGKPRRVAGTGVIAEDHTCGNRAARLVLREARSGRAARARTAVTGVATEIVLDRFLHVVLEIRDARKGAVVEACAREDGELGAV